MIPRQPDRRNQKAGKVMTLKATMLTKAVLSLCTLNHQTLSPKPQCRIAAPDYLSHMWGQLSLENNRSKACTERFGVEGLRLRLCG